MPYVSLTQTLIDPAQDYVRNNLSNRINSFDGKEIEVTFFKREILARGAHLGLTPANALIKTVDTFVGLIGSVGVILTLGRHEDTLNFSDRHLVNCKTIVSQSYSHLLKFINPHASCDNWESYVKEGRHGYLTNYTHPIRRFAKESVKSENFFKRNISSRLGFAALAVACVVTRVADAILSVITMALSLVTVGLFKKVNNVALRSAQAMGLTHDLFYCATKILNPSAEISF